MVGQKGFGDEDDRLKKLERKKPSLERLCTLIPWEDFRPWLESIFPQEHKSPAARKRIGVIIMFKMLVLQQLHHLSDEELEFQVNDRPSFERFMGLGVMHSIPDVTTVELVARFREQLRQAGILAERFQQFDADLKKQGRKARGGPIMDATIVPVPKQRHCQEENKDIKQGKVPEAWQEHPNRLRQKDLDARWVKKHGVSHYGYKNSISVEVAYGLIRRHAFTPANLHDSHMLPVGC